MIFTRSSSKAPTPETARQRYDSDRTTHSFRKMDALGMAAEIAFSPEPLPFCQSVVPCSREKRKHTLAPFTAAVPCHRETAAFFRRKIRKVKTARGKTKSKSRAQKNRRYAPCGTISCFIRPLFSFCGGSVGVPCLLLTEKTNTCDERACAKTIRYPVKQRPETICQTEKVISWRTGGHGGRL